MKIVACSVTVDIETTKRSLALFGPLTKDCVKQFLGIHPESAARENLEEFVDIFQTNLSQIDGVGEVGLDRTYVERGVPYDIQNNVFERMLSLAESSGKPVSVHSRKSLDDILQVLPSFRLKSCLLHWFAGNSKQLARAMDLGAFVSFGPATVYSNDKKALLKQARPDRVLIETDGPVRYSKCFDRYPALSTSFLTTVALTIAQILDLTFAEMVAILERNAASYLKS
jgi:TatD DNase family protein